MKDFFISYHRNDRQWAEWMAWTLEENGFTITFQDWDFRAGDNYILKVQQALAESRQTIVVLSADYLADLFTQAQWASIFASDPTGEQRRLLPMRVAHCQLPLFMQAIIVCDLFNLAADAASEKLLEAVRHQPARKPTQFPSFPGGVGLPTKGELATVARELLDILDTTDVTFDAQAQVRDLLVNKVEVRLEIATDWEYEEFLQRYFSQMNEEELHLHKTIRAYTENVLYEYNARALEILQKYPELKRKIPLLNALERHYVVWKSKYDGVFKVSPFMGLLYVGVLERTPFPEGVEDEIWAFLQEQAE